MSENTASGKFTCQKCGHAQDWTMRVELADPVATTLLIEGRQIVKSLQSEREDTVKMLREVCEWHGDNDWPDDLNLADVIEKHLIRHLE